MSVEDGGLKPPAHEQAEQQAENILRENVLGVATILRHGETNYTGVYPDLTEKGIADMKQRGEELRGKIQPDEEVAIGASPTVRADASAKLVKEGLGHEGEVTFYKSMRSIEVRDADAAVAMLARVGGPEKDVDKIDAAFVETDAFDHAWEPRSSMEKRFARSLTYLVRGFETFRAAKPDRVPRFVGVSHFEIANQLATKAFGLTSKTGYLKRGEGLDIVFLKPDTARPDVVPMILGFRGETAKALFDRKTRTVMYQPDEAL